MFLNCSATTLHFDIKNDNKSNEILKEFADKNCEGRKYAVISHYYDIDNDNKPEIIGIVKSKSYYSSSGYKLIVLKKNGSNWENIKSDIFFDPNQEFKINKNKITYHKSIFFNNKKCKAKIKKDEIITSKSFLDLFRNKKAENIEEITAFHKSNTKNEFELSNFNAHPQKSVNFYYVNLDERTKHYLDIK